MVDSAAQVTVMSNVLAECLGLKLDLAEKVNLKTVNGDNLTAIKVKEVSLGI